MILKRTFDKQERIFSKMDEYSVIEWSFHKEIIQEQTKK